jgi:hypothetical protein
MTPDAQLSLIETLFRLNVKKIPVSAEAHRLIHGAVDSQSGSRLLE